MSISFNLGKKLVLLVMLVTTTALGLTSYISVDYASETLKERGGELSHGESDIRGESLKLLFESRIEQNNILANDPMIQSLILEMNQVSENKLQESQEKNRRNYLIQVQAFQELAGFSIGFEETKIIGNDGQVFISISSKRKENLAIISISSKRNDGQVFFSLTGYGNENFLNKEIFQKGLKGSFIDFESAESGKKLIVVSPVFADDSQQGDEPIGVIISKMRTASIDNVLLNRSGLGETGEVYIVNSDYLMLSESRFFENAIFDQRVNTIGVQKCLTKE